MIDWSALSNPVSKYFTVAECLYLSRWTRLANEQDGLDDKIKSNLLILCMRLDFLREFFNKPIIVHCMYRPKEYNALIGGAPGSAHVEGLACDFHVLRMGCDEIREIILPHLEEWQLRMEDLPGSGWIHLDIRDPGDGNRYFKP